MWYNMMINVALPVAVVGRENLRYEVNNVDWLVVSEYANTFKNVLFSKPSKDIIAGGQKPIFSTIVLCVYQQTTSRWLRGKQLCTQK